MIVLPFQSLFDVPLPPSQLSPWVNVGWEIQAVQPPHPKPERFGAIAIGDTGTEAPFVPPVVTIVGWGFDPTLPLFKKNFRDIHPWDDGTRSPLINFFPAGWEIQSFQPPHPFTEKRGSIVPKEDGNEFTKILWFNAGWEIQSVQPPIPWKIKAGSGAIARGDDGSEKQFVNWINAGWEIQSVQPPHPRPERSASIMRGDDGTEAALVNFFPTAWDQIGHWKYVRAKDPSAFGDNGTQNITTVVVTTVGWGFDPQPYQPQHTTFKGGAIARTDDGNEFPLINFYAAGWEIQPPQPPAYRVTKSGAIMPRDDGNEFPQINFYAAGWEIQSVQPKHIFQKQYLKPEDGIEAFFIPSFVTSGWGFEPQLHQPQRIIAKGGAFARDDNGNEFPLINFYPAGWEIQAVQPNAFRAKRSGIMAGDDGTESQLVNWYNAGWEFQIQPPRHIFNKQFLLIEDGTENTLAVAPTFVSWGFDPNQPQPQHPRPERWAALIGGDDGTEFSLVGWYNFGWEIQTVQPPWHHTKPGIMPWEDGDELTKINWQNFGWQLQDVQPGHPRPERFGAIAPWEDGIEASFIFVPPPVNLTVFRPLMGVGI